MHKVIRIQNLDCANCAAELSERLAGIAGIESADADFLNQRVTLDYENEQALGKAIAMIAHFEKVVIVDENAPRKKERHLKEVISIALAVVFFVPALVLSLCGIAYWVSFAFFLASALAAGWDVLYQAARNFAGMFRGGFHPSVFLDEHFLMTIALPSACSFS